MHARKIIIIQKRNSHNYRNNKGKQLQQQRHNMYVTSASKIIMVNILCVSLYPRERYNSLKWNRLEGQKGNISEKVFLL